MTVLTTGDTAVHLLHFMAPRTGQSSGTGSIVVDAVISVLFFLIGLFSLYVSVRGGLNVFNLSRNSVVVKGSITAHRSRSTGAGGRVVRAVGEQYLATYRYEYGGKTYSHEQAVGGIPLVGEAVSVRCVAHHPNVALLEGPASASLIKERKVALVVMPLLAATFLGVAIFEALQLLR
ncbi:MAG TPA: DUF3592 domain-containing protein [Ktedonobacteraceae bacterium]|nr:DUF3592 domain-containing protein [Ktedonobacteraceae bacterium]